MKIVKYSTNWCAPCKQMKPHWDVFVKEHPEIEFEEVNAAVVITVGIKAVPTIIVYDDNKEVKRVVGYQTKQQLDQLIDK